MTLRGKSVKAVNLEQYNCEVERSQTGEKNLKSRGKQRKCIQLSYLLIIVILVLSLSYMPFLVQADPQMGG